MKQQSRLCEARHLHGSITMPRLAIGLSSPYASASTKIFAQRFIDAERDAGYPPTPFGERARDRLWHAARGRSEKQQGMNKPILLFVLLIAQAKLGFNPNADLSKHSSKRLRKILRANYERIACRGCYYAHHVPCTAPVPSYVSWPWFPNTVVLPSS